MKGLTLVCFHKTISVKLSVIGGSAVFSNPVLKVGKEQSAPSIFCLLPFADCRLIDRFLVTCQLTRGWILRSWEVKRYGHPSKIISR